METPLGLVGMLIFIVAVIAFAAAVTWVVVKLDTLVRNRKAAPAG
jgi:hypothetical protein